MNLMDSLTNGQGFIFLNLFLNVFIYGCVGSLLLRAGLLSLAAVSGATLRCGAWASHCSGFSCCRSTDSRCTRASIAVACGLSSCGLRALESRLSSCGAWA